ncbi:MAG: class I SAM-dependent methyltransferase [Gemmatimonadetes bacterium]|nr:class I SAM-dependent methyltransferase [Gemmatimonadota bacterium]
MYGPLASWWPLVSAPEDYAEEAALYVEVLLDRAPSRPTLLELGSGGGNNALHMKRHFTAVTLVDLSEGMITVSRTLNPDCEHLTGDMRCVRLDRTFDCVFVHDAICYMTSEHDLSEALQTAFAHLDAGGVALFAPDYVRETYEPSTDHGGHDGSDRSVRFLEWGWDPDPNDCTYVVDYLFALRESSGEVRTIHDRHIEGLFPRATWRRLLSRVGFEVEELALAHSEVDRPLISFVGRRPR